MGLSQLVKQISPCGVCNHLLKPRWGLPETRARPKVSLESGKSVLQKQSLQLEETPGGGVPSSGEAGLATVIQSAARLASWVPAHSF